MKSAKFWGRKEKRVDPALHEQWKYEDPYANDRGSLLSNRIHEFCSRAGLLISDGFYNEKNLRPASYTLTIGEKFVDSEGNEGRLTDEKDSFIFHQNSIIFVTANEKLDLPYYILARFNLRVNWVYDGILLGTGPQVDPGFSGFLSCPLYNLTNADLTIKRGAPFATIDFEKTTTLLDKMKSWQEKKDYIQRTNDKVLMPADDEKYSFYRTPEMDPLQHRKTHKIISSLFEMREEVRTWRQLGIGSLVAFFGLTLSLLAFGANLYRQNTDLSRQVVETKGDLQEAHEQILHLREDLKRLLGGDKQTVPPTGKASEKSGKRSP